MECCSGHQKHANSQSQQSTSWMRHAKCEHTFQSHSMMEDSPSTSVPKAKLTAVQWATPSIPMSSSKCQVPSSKTRPLWSRSGRVLKVPTEVRHKHCVIELPDKTQINLLPEEIWDPDDSLNGPDFHTDTPEQGSPLPQWITPGHPIACHNNGNHPLLGELEWSDDHNWCFCQDDES